MLVMDGHGSHIDIEFMWICKQNNVQLVFLPPHTPHVLQPLDLGVFSPLKTRYRRNIADLSTLDDSAPVKKQRFVSCYNLARKEALTPKVTKSGWKAAGIVPWNPSKGLYSSQVKQPIPRPTTPPNQDITPTQYAINTPKSSQQIDRVVKTIRNSKRIKGAQLAAKAGKAISLLNARHALDKQTLQLRDSQLQQLSSKNTRKRITVDPNTRFTTIEQIKEAQAAQAVSKAIAEAKQPELQAKKAAEAMLQASLQSCQFEWQS